MFTVSHLTKQRIKSPILSTLLFSTDTPNKIGLLLHTLIHPKMHFSCGNQSFSKSHRCVSVTVDEVPAITSPERAAKTETFPAWNYCNSGVCGINIAWYSSRGGPSRDCVGLLQKMDLKWNGIITKAPHVIVMMRM